MTQARKGRCWSGADDRIRTGDIELGRIALYQLSYVRLVQVPAYWRYRRDAADQTGQTSSRDSSTCGRCTASTTTPRNMLAAATATGRPALSNTE